MGRALLEKPMLKQVVICAMLINLAIANLASAQQAPPASDKARQIETLVNKAAALIDSKGKAAFPEFRVEFRAWWLRASILEQGWIPPPFHRESVVSRPAT